MSQTYNLGKVAITPRGAYSSTAQYTPLDILSYNGSSYLVLQNCMGVTPPNATYYMVVASKGDTGSAGASPTIAAGTVTMTPAGTSASVTNVGTNVNASFNFTLPSGNVIYTGTGVTGTSTTPTIFSGSGVANAGVGDIYFNTNIVAFYQCTLGGVANTAEWVFLTYAVPDGSITTAKIDDSAVTRNKIADGAIGTDEIADGSVSSFKLGSDVTATLENKANVDGAYEQMTVGNAEQLVSTVGITDESPYLFRTSGGSVDIGDRENDKIVGGTIAWNQLYPTINSEDIIRNYSDDTISISDGVISFTAGRQYGGFRTTTGKRFGIVSGHKYLTSFEAKAASNGVSFRYNYTLSGSGISEYFSLTTSWAVYATIKRAGVTGESDIPFQDTRSSGWDEIQVKNIRFHDLTAMFGWTIADYIYALEQANAGAGVAYFRKLFPKPYYAYNAGQLMSVNTSAHNMTGFNQWDEEWELGGINATTGENTDGTATIRAKNKFRILPNTVYHLKCSAAVAARYYDANNNYLASYAVAITANSNFTTPSEAAYMRFQVFAAYGTTYNHDICINLSWDGERDGEYEPYREWNYPLDSSLTLHGIPKLDASNNLYYDGDEYASDGTVTRRYGAVDLGTLSWSYNSTVTRFSTGSLASVVARPSGNNVIGNIKCAKYVTDITDHGTDANYDKIIMVANSGNVFIRDSAYDSDVALKASLSGVYLVYELATPTTETADPYTNPQIVDDWGTEEYVDYGYYTGTRDVSIPVGHDTLYAANLRAKLEMSPNSPDGDGLYAVRQSGGINTYEEIIFPTELPTAPSSEGTYYLKATVDGEGNVTYSWQSNA